MQGLKRHRIPDPDPQHWFSRVRDQLHRWCPAYAMNGINNFKLTFWSGRAFAQNLNWHSPCTWSESHTLLAHCFTCHATHHSLLRSLQKMEFASSRLTCPRQACKMLPEYGGDKCDKTSPSLSHYILISLLQNHRCVLSFFWHIYLLIYNTAAWQNVQTTVLTFLVLPSLFIIIATLNYI